MLELSLENWMAIILLIAFLSGALPFLCLLVLALNILI